MLEREGEEREMGSGSLQDEELWAVPSTPSTAAIRVSLHFLSLSLPQDFPKDYFYLKFLYLKI